MNIEAIQWVHFGIGLGLGLGMALIVWLAARRTRDELRAKTQELKHQEALEHEREQALALATERLSHAFGQLAHEQFQSHSETFLKLARESLGAHHERAKGELAAREQAIDNLLRPMREVMQRTEAQLNELDKARRETHGSITAQLEAMAVSQQLLSSETRNLVNALRRPEVRGQWGEITLQRLVELAGMVEYCDFQTQAHTPTQTGAVRPDMLINLPEGRQLVVDVKTPLDAYLEATEADNEQARRAALGRHASIVQNRIRELSSKAYWTQFDSSPEFVILFIPGDQFLSAALSVNPEILDEALRQNVILATPTSLVALLKAVAYGWQQVALADNAAEIRGLAVQLYERLGTFTSHLARLGKSLGDGIKAYNQSVGSLERMVLPSARRFTELGVKPRQELNPPLAVEDTAREPAIGDETPDAEPVSEEPTGSGDEAQAAENHESGPGQPSSPGSTAPH